MSEHTRIVSGASNASKVAAGLVLDSSYFTLTPLPDDDYEFLVRSDRVRALDLIIAKVDAERALHS